MRKVVGVVVAVAAMLVLAAVAWPQSGTASAKPPKAKVAANVKVAITEGSYTFISAGLNRAYEVIAPVKGLPASAPVIVVLSGIGATIGSEVLRDDLVPYVTSNQAELVYPAGFAESWNAVTCCGAAATRNVNDEAFLKALVPRIDPGHARPVYLVGYSNGGRLAYRMACADPGLFDEYAVVKAAPTPGCDLRKPVTILQVAAVNDPEVPYRPGDHGLANEPLPMTTLVSDLQRTEKCPARGTVRQSGQMILTTWSGCGGGTRLGFAVWPGGGHAFPAPPVNQPAAAQVIWSFFTRTKFAPLPK
jgi:polyhydroxybutyrate depolymerase